MKTILGDIGSLAEEFSKLAAAEMPTVTRAIARNAFYAGAAVVLIRALADEPNADQTARALIGMLREVMEYDSIAELDKEPETKLSVS